MSWLAKMKIDARIAYEKHLLDSYAWHCALWDCFPDNPAKKRDFLTRVDEHQGYFEIWVLSHEKPLCPSWFDQGYFASKEIAPSFLSHSIYAFDLKANPTKAIVQRDEYGSLLRKQNGKRKSGKRVPLVNENELRCWLERKAAVGGFRIFDSKSLEIGRMIERYFSQKGNRAYHGVVQFRGKLEVTDHALFEQSYYSGIGGAKGFGLGLLLLAPLG